MILPYAAIGCLVVVTAYAAAVSFMPQEGRSPSWMFPPGTSRSIKRITGILTVALLIGLAVWVGLGNRKSTHRSSRFLIPEGFTGWVRIEFEVKGAPTAPIEDGEYVFKIPGDGKLLTSSAEQYGWADDHYYYYSDQNVRPIADSGPTAMIWGKINGEAYGASGKRKYEEFFVGSNQQFKDQPK